MRRVINALPSAKQTTITMAVCLVLGVIIAGPHPKALVGLAIGVLVLAVLTVRNYDPMTWEAYNDPVAHSMRLQRDKAVEHLRAVVVAFDKNDRTALVFEMSGARKLLDENYPSTPAR